MIDPKSIKGLSSDSRVVKPGWLFAALQGSKADGETYIADAIRNGASVILGGDRATIPENLKNDHTRLIQSENPRLDFSRIASAFYGRQPDSIAAVTGTNGKTSTAVFTQLIWEALAHKSVS
ncbi:MAG TPA: Mur ligase domain-containing protein, partial [Alphaproteobacteria bacterium]|nr:Mur ligase domain-containing protein [Alphaproteobacteria bacterium]